MVTSINKQQACDACNAPVEVRGACYNCSTVEHPARCGVGGALLDCKPMEHPDCSPVENPAETPLL